MKPRPSFVAFRALTDALGDSPTYQGFLPLGQEGAGYGFVFQADGENVLIAWMPKGKTTSVRFDSSLFAIDSTGATIVERILLSFDITFVWANVLQILGYQAFTNSSIVKAAAVVLAPLAALVLIGAVAAAF